MKKKDPEKMKALNAVRGMIAEAVETTSRLRNKEKKRKAMEFLDWVSHFIDEIERWPESYLIDTTAQHLVAVLVELIYNPELALTVYDAAGAIMTLANEGISEKHFKKVGAVYAPTSKTLQ